jgi:hypothetical protein
MIRWYDGISPVTAWVRCRGEHHRITWRRGRIVAEDHDVEAEAALAALGGGACACLDVVRVTRTGLGVDELFLLWTEHAEPSVGASQALERWARRVGAGAPSATVVGRRAEEARLAALSSLPVEFRRRLALGVFEAISREPDRDRSGSHPSFAPVFGSLVGRAVRAARLPRASADALDVRWTLLSQSEPVSVEGSCTARLAAIRLGLSASWVAKVWAWDLAVVDGQLVVDAVHWSREYVSVALVTWTDGGHARLGWRHACRPQGSNGGWHVSG